MSMPKTYTHILSTSGKYVAGFLVKSFGGVVGVRCWQVSLACHQVTVFLLGRLYPCRLSQITTVQCWCWTPTMVYIQGRNGVRGHPGQEASLAPLCWNLRPVGSKCTVLKRVFVALLGLFCGLRSHSAPPWWSGARGIVPLLPPLVTPLCVLSPHLFIIFSRVPHTTARRPNPTCEPISPGHKHILPIMKKYA